MVSQRDREDYETPNNSERVGWLSDDLRWSKDFVSKNLNILVLSGRNFVSKINVDMPKICNMVCQRDREDYETPNNSERVGWLSDDLRWSKDFVSKNLNILVLSGRNFDSKFHVKSIFWTFRTGFDQIWFNFGKIVFGATILGYRHTRVVISLFWVFRNLSWWNHRL